jgi:hypothetical protein
MKYPIWRKEMKIELQALLDNRACRMEENTKGRKPIRSVWAYKAKRDTKEIQRFGEQRHILRIEVLPK